MKQTRNCPITGKSLEPFHGNRKIHPEAVKARKHEANKKRHAKVKDINMIALNQDRILEYYYQLSEGVTEIDKSMLLEFKWDFITRISNSKPPVF